jgi:hypothetical protein
MSVQTTPIMNLQTISNACHEQPHVSDSRTASDCLPQHNMAQPGKLGSGFRRPPPLQLSELPEVQEEVFEGPRSALGSLRHHGSGFSTPALLQLVLDAAAPTAASIAAPSPGAGGLCSPAQRCLFAGLKPGDELQPDSSCSSSSSSVARGVTPDVVDRVTVDRWLQGMEARQAPCTRGGKATAEADVPPPAFVVLQLLG